MTVYAFGAIFTLLVVGGVMQARNYHERYTTVELVISAVGCAILWPVFWGMAFVEAWRNR